MRYALCETKKENQKVYGVQMILHTSEGMETETAEDLFTDELSAKNFIRYLYENSADIVHFKDLAYDYII